MGGGCSCASPRGKRWSVSLTREENEQEAVSMTTGPGPAVTTSAQLTSHDQVQTVVLQQQQNPQLCFHAVCTLLRQKDWTAVTNMLVLGKGIDVTLTKFLERALYEGCPHAIFEQIIEKGANPLESTRCLSDAILGRAEYATVKRLLDFGCSPNELSPQDKLKRAPIHFALQSTTTPLIIVQLLVQYGADLNLRSGDRFWSPVHYLACANHDHALLRYVCRNGGNINLKDRDSNTPMIIASMKRASTEFFRTMLELGADPSISTLDGRTALTYLTKYQYAPPGDVREVLLQPKYRQNQLLALCQALHKDLGRNSFARELNPDIILLVGKFLVGEKSSDAS